MTGDAASYLVEDAALRAYAAATDDVPGGPVFAIVPVWSAIAPASRSVASDDDARARRPLRAGRARPPARSRRGRHSSHRRRPSPSSPAPTARRSSSAPRPARADGELVNEQWVTEFFRGVETPESVGERAPDHALRDAGRAGDGDRASASPTTRRSGTRPPPATTSRSTSTTRSRGRSGCRDGSSTGSARWPTRAAPPCRRSPSTTRDECAGSRSGSPLRCSPATTLTTRVWRSGRRCSVRVGQR